MIVLDLLPDLIYSDATYKITWNIIITMLDYRSEIHLIALLHPAYMQDHLSIINFNNLLL